jgi:hypothetical protein
LAEEAARALLTKEMVAARAAELADRHRKLQSSFKELCSIVGDGVVALGADEEGVNYTARIIANVDVEFRADSEDSDEEVVTKQGIILGGYGCGGEATYYFRVRENEFGVRDYASGGRAYPSPSIEALLLDDVEPQVEDLEGTVDMLWRAAQNPDLNPELAARVQAEVVETVR